MGEAKGADAMRFPARGSKEEGIGRAFIQRARTAKGGNWFKKGEESETRKSRVSV